MTKHRMFGAPNLRQSKEFAQPLVVMVETFRMSEPDVINRPREADALLQKAWLVI